MPSHDGIHGLWFMKVTPIHDRLALERAKSTSTRMDDQKDASKGTAPNNYRPITCLLMPTMYIDGIKMFDNNEKESETLIQTVRIYNQDIGMEFGVKMFVTLYCGAVLNITILSYDTKYNNMLSRLLLLSGNIILCRVLSW